jgi:putative hydrolase of the HAD superfamily
MGSARQPLGLEAFEQEAVREAHIDHITDDLAAFLSTCLLPETGALRA